MIYLDANATTPLHPEVLAAMLPLFRDNFANPSSVHAPGQAARAALDGAREQCAAVLSCAPKELVFTSGGTEADALAILGVASAAMASGAVADPRDPDAPSSARPRPRVVVTAVEHPAVLGPCAALSRAGVEVVQVGVDPEGRLDEEALAAALLAPGTVLCSVMAANNETGVVFPIARIGALCRSRGVPLHVDAVQWIGKEEVCLRDLPIDLLSLSAHKLEGPKGAGLLWARSGVALRAVQEGGHQERGRRAGTENAAGIVGLSEALRRACAGARGLSARLGPLRDRLEAAARAIPGTLILGAGAPRVSNTVCAAFEGCEGETLLAALDLRGVAVSTGSACSSGSLSPSKVLLAMGLAPARARGAVRFSLWSGNTAAEIETVAGLLPGIVARARGGTLSLA
ncbi:MAG TPA: cysteine desulfurase family protein [Myxococcales bacterium]|nr:cysteine desulfurase family protein [Myxococcales bacterium]